MWSGRDAAASEDRGSCFHQVGRAGAGVGVQRLRREASSSQQEGPAPTRALSAAARRVTSYVFPPTPNKWAFTETEPENTPPMKEIKHSGKKSLNVFIYARWEKTSSVWDRSGYGTYNCNTEA